MRRIPIELYTCGDIKYLLLDEVAASYIQEQDKTTFAVEICKTFDTQSVLIIQSLEKRILSEINSVRQYWDELPLVAAEQSIAILVRCIDSSGQEQNTSPEALLTTQYYFEERYQFVPPIMIDVPTSTATLYQEELHNEPLPQLIFRGTYTDNPVKSQFPKTFPNDLHEEEILIISHEDAAYEEELELAALAS